MDEKIQKAVIDFDINGFLIMVQNIREITGLHLQIQKGGRHWEAIALGGGMIEMQQLEDFLVTINGDFYELLVIK